MHLASSADANAHSIFIVNDAPRTGIAKTRTEGVEWGEPTAVHKVRIERDVDAGTVRVFFDDMNEPIMTAESKAFEWGMIGFGSFDDMGRFDNVRIRSKETRVRKNPPFD